MQRWLTIACLLAWVLPVYSAEPVKTSNEPKGTQIQWYGHAFIYVTLTSGVRVAIDPFGTETVKYPFPSRLTADAILISNEGESHSASESLFGTPQVFRSVTAIGLNKANGFLFKGVETYRDDTQGATLGGNTSFVFEADDLKFAHLGDIGHPLDAKQRNELGYVDVLFLPVGNQKLAVSDLNKIARDLNAKIIVPIGYKTPLSGDLELRSLDEFLAGQSEIKRIDSSGFEVSPATLPKKPTIYVLKSP